MTGLIDRWIGKTDAIYVKTEYQNALDYTHGQVKKRIKWCSMMNRKLKNFLASVQKYKKDIIADQEERASLYQNLSNLLSKETNFEKEMLKISKKGKKNTRVSIKQNMKYSEIDDFRINAIQEYISKYPEYVSKSTYKKVLEKITEIEKGIKITKKKYNRAVSEVLKEIAFWPKNIMQSEDLVKLFREQMEEGQNKLKNMRYLNSIFYRLASEEEKAKVNIHTLYYRMDNMENIIKQLKEEVNRAKKQDLEEMDY
jgi:hypothetical protein